NGFNVYPREVELALLDHPDVVEVAVIGAPDDETGETVTALVVAGGDRSPSAEELGEHCAARLARFKRPSQITLVDELPHSLSGKVAKGKLRNQHE
ncbi:MAG TPA: AMP-dependent synthetase, partial [Actinomycetes bacterium]|nr:AMP-dependent synthetase [Actinomycetes bacterium]